MADLTIIMVPYSKSIRLLVLLLLLFSLSCSETSKDEKQIKDEAISTTFQFFETINGNNQKEAKEFLSKKAIRSLPVNEDFEVLKAMIDKHGFPSKKFMNTSVYGTDFHLTIYFDEPKEGWVRPDVKVHYYDFRKNLKIDYLFATSASKVPKLNKSK